MQKDNPPVTPEQEQQAISEQRAIRRQKLEALRQNGQDPYTQTRYDKQHMSMQIKADYASMEGQEVCVAGRMMSRRIMGKASFAHILDEQGELQLYIQRNEIGDEAYAAFKNMDLGDIIGAKGTVFQTRTG